MGKETLYVEGLKELQAALRKFPDAAKRGARRGLTSGAIRVQRSAREYAPKDTGQAGLTGSIAYVVQTVASGVRAIVGSAKKYAPYVEFETKPHFVPAKYIGKWAERHDFGYTGLFVSGKAQPFLRPAMTDNRELVVADLVRSVRAEIAKLAG